MGIFQLPEDKDQALDLAEIAVETLNVIAQIIGGATATTSASAVTIINVILNTLRQGFEGKITAEQVRKDLQKLFSSLDLNDQAADKALEEKFDTSDSD